MTILFLLAACTGHSDKPDDTSASGALTIDGLSSEADAIAGTVLTVTWTTPVAASAAVEFGEDDTYGQTIEGASSADGLEHTVVVAGLAGGVDWHWRAVSDDGSGAVTSADTVFSAPAPPAALDVFEMLNGEGVGDGFTLTSTLARDSSDVVILDDHARPVWWYRSGVDGFVSQARMSADGRAVVALVGTRNGGSDAVSQLLRIPIGDGDVSSIDVPSSHHDFIEVGDGSFAVIVADRRTYAGEQVEGDDLVEVTDAGDSRIVWSSWDTLTPGDPAAMEHVGDIADWTHCNGVAWDPDTETYLVSSHNLDALYAIGRSDGAIRWQMGGAESDFTLEQGQAFHGQHSPTFVPGGVLVFDNGTSDAAASAVREYTYDEGARTYAERWTYAPAEPRYVFVHGSAERLPSGDTFTGWGSTGRIAEVDGDGAIVWEMAAPEDLQLGFSHPVAALGGAP